ncbi:MAG TPA: Gfo/Idh/MocA family oxidoreductase [Acidimicrobiales bacterium]|nr:Gfo/Idh/MocA family oxidoreductase [Acidimicrobiales bacterium]
MAVSSRFVIVGGGWRAEFFLRAARAMPEVVTCVGVTSRQATRRNELSRSYGVEVPASVAEVLERPVEFVVLASSRESMPDLLEEITSHGVPVLVETPPGLDIAGLRRSWRASQSGRAQVAEQYRFQPHHAARLAVLNDGVIGERHQAWVSVAHGYHAVSLLYEYLDLTRDDWPEISVSAHRMSAPVVRGPDRRGPPGQEEQVTSERVVAIITIGDKAGIYDFDPQQYFSEIRSQHVAVRGERGELHNDDFTYLPAGTAWRAQRAHLVRVEGGQYGDLGPLGLEEIRFGDKAVFAKRPGLGPLTDEEIAVAECLIRMADYARGGPEFYSVHRACCDRFVEMAVGRSLESQQTVVCRPTDWLAGTTT